MTVSAELVEQVRRRANFACEYCGVTETDAGGQLSVDHFRPQVHGGSDDLDNLVYCCFRCNLYKAGYWPAQSSSPMLWNPRQDPQATHLLGLADGTLYAITSTGAFTLKRLRLNRPSLVAHRLRRQTRAEEQRLLARLQELAMLLEQLHQQQTALLEEHRALLKEKRTLLRLLLKRQG
jgi:hypothetical protein